jgi:hypothetical protein
MPAHPKPAHGWFSCSPSASGLISELAGQRTQQREISRRESVQAEAKQVDVLVRVLDEVLQFLEHVPVEEREEQPVRLQCGSGGESGASQQGEEVLHVAQGPGRSFSQGSVERAGEQQGQGVRVSQRELAEVLRDRVQFGLPVDRIRVDV